MASPSRSPPVHPYGAASYPAYPSNWLLTAVASGVRRLWAFRWLFGIPMATLFLVASIYAVRTPNFFEATALVCAVDRMGGQRNDLPQQTDGRAKDFIATAFDRILTPTNLAMVAQEVGLGSAASGPGALAEQFTIETKSDYIFTVAARWPEPGTAAAMVNALLDAATRSEKRALGDAAKDRIDFRTRESRDADVAYRKAQQALQNFDYKEENKHTLPNLEVSIEQAILIKDGRLKDLKRVLQDAESTLRVLLGKPVLGNPSSRRQPVSLDPTAAAKDETAKLDARLKELRRKKDVRLAATGPRHRDVLRFQAEIDVLERDLRELELQNVGHSGESDPSAATPGAPPPLLVQAAESTNPEVAPVRLRWTSAAEDIQELEQELQGLRARLGLIPVTASRRQEFVDRLEEATRLRDARATEVSRANLKDDWIFKYPELSLPFVVEQAAMVPASPAGPDRMRIALTGLGIGAALGYGLFLLRRKFEHPTVAGANDIRDLLPVALIVDVPRLSSGLPARRRLRSSGRGLLFAAWVIFCVAASLYLVAGRADPATLPSWVRGLLWIPTS